MLQVPYIRNHKEEVITKLAVKNFDAKDTIDEIIALDEKSGKHRLNSTIHLQNPTSYQRRSGCYINLEMSRKPNQKS